jgi:peptide/nickel transport system permease protein
VLRFIIKRLFLAVAVAFTVSMISFSLLFMAGDPAIALAGESATEADIEAYRVQYGFDRPIFEQYVSWLGNFLTGDFGKSYYFGTPVFDLVMSKLPVTMTLGFCAITFAILISIPMGAIAATRPNSLIDRVALFIAVVGQAMPSFWFALLMIVAFAVKLGWPPVSGSSSWYHFIMPTIALGYYATPAIMRLTRAGMMEVLGTDYIRTARAKGMSPTKILFKHALRNAVIPVVGLAAVQLGFMLSGSVIIESIFALNGAGFLAFESISRNDFPVVQALIMIFSLIYVLLTLLSDVLNAWLDPRIRTA